MNTFLPYPDFKKSAEVLDKKRCWKQVVEAKQILAILNKLSDASQQCGDDEEFKIFKKTLPWVNHPAVKMWSEHIWLLDYYYNAFLKVCKEKYKINTSLQYAIEQPVLFVNNPWWLGNENFHRSHRSRLIEKDKNFYLNKFPEDENYNDGLYWWPNMENNTFKLIIPKLKKV